MPTWLTEDLPGSGGQLLAEPSDFVVHEILSYEPCGDGEHALIEIEKVGLTTIEATDRLAQALGLGRGAIGYAGLKDKYARTRQWISIPVPVKAPLPQIDIEIPGVRLLQIGRHKNKIKRGHQKGNRFWITIRDIDSGGLDRAQAILAQLRQRGVPNAFGPQRFGNEGDNVARGVAVIRGEIAPPKNRRIRGLLMSAIQSEVFNRVLAARIEAGLISTALAGDVMQKHDTHGLFDVTDPELEQARVDRLEISPTAALPGPKARSASGLPQQMEEAALAELGLSEENLRRLDVGTRRVLRYPLPPEARIDAVEGDERAFTLDVVLPSGAYATVLLGEIMKPSAGQVTRTSGDG